MKFLTAVVAVVCVVTHVTQVRAFSISSVEVVGDGKDETRPAKEGNLDINSSF